MTLVHVTRKKLRLHSADKLTETTDLLLISADESKLRKVVSSVVNEMGHTLSKNSACEVQTSASGQPSSFDQLDDSMVSSGEDSNKDSWIVETQGFDPFCQSVLNRLRVNSMDFFRSMGYSAKQSETVNYYPWCGGIS